MILCVGIGNTNIKCAVGFKENYRHAVLPAEEINKPEDLIFFLEEQFQAGFWEMLQGSIVSSVVPAKTDFITEIMRKKNNGVFPQRIDITKCGIDFSKYKSKLGEDRAVCCAGALVKYKPPFVVVDFGTATTVNIIDPDGIFIGGSIMVGVQTGLTALNRHTAGLPRLCEVSDIDVIGGDTKKCLASGAFIGTAYAVGGYISHVREMLNTMPKVIVTGGAASLVMPHCRFDYMYEPMLLIDGLLELYDNH